MPNDEERREVAARLRILATHREVDKEFVEDALGLYMGECVDGYDPVSVNELADLIDPGTSNDRLEDRLISPIASPIVDREALMALADEIEVCGAGAMDDGDWCKQLLIEYADRIRRALGVARWISRA